LETWRATSGTAAHLANVSHGKALRCPPGGPEEEFLYTRVYVNDAGAWLLAANQIARPSESVRPSGVGH
jgi:hypothetical protein